MRKNDNSSSRGPRTSSGGRPKSPGAGKRDSGRPRAGGTFKGRSEGGFDSTDRKPRFGQGAAGKPSGRQFDQGPGRGPKRDTERPAGGFGGRTAEGGFKGRPAEGGFKGRDTAGGSRGPRRDSEGSTGGFRDNRSGDWGTGGYGTPVKRGGSKGSTGFKGPRRDDDRAEGFKSPRRDNDEGFRGRRDSQPRAEGFKAPARDAKGFKGSKRDGDSRSEGFRGAKKEGTARTGGFKDKKSFDKAPRAPFKKFEDRRPKDEPIRKDMFTEEAEAGDEEREDRIEGRNPVFEALRSGRPLNKLFIETDNDDPMLSRITAMAREKDIPIQFLERRKLDMMSQTRIHQGVILEVAAQEYVEVEDILSKAEEKGEKPFIIVLDGITDTNNLGSIIRSAECAGVHGMIIPKRRSASLNATVAKVAAGALEYMPVARVANLVQTLRELKEEGVWVIGADMDGENDYYDTDLKGPCALVIGSEGEGLSRLTKDECDILVKIPMKGKISSLNAGVAAALVMFEIAKQRK
ncbi:MAG: 23S rRNA (guanosine(2251)-2'-O)-methyltransferase RlmB [Clostridia bacterium]|nr:23S rRNA (guanosine(2251)-2'-O)-methyltransferase RlmB [Clostridia bacterium]